MEGRSKTEQLREMEREYLFYSLYAESMRILDFIISESQGCIIKDVEGKSYIDFTSAFAVCNVGHRHQSIMKAVLEQLQTLPHMSGHLARNESMILLAKKLCEITPGDFKKRCAFRLSGAEAVETALSIARANKRAPIIISFLGDYHGLTMGSLGVSFMLWRTGFQSFVTPATFPAPYPYCYRCYLNQEYPDCGLACFTYLERAIDTITNSPELDLAGLIIEPIEGERGIVVPPDDYLVALRKLCEEKGIIFIADEIQTGLGRTGKMFALEHVGIDADLICLGKALGGGIVPLSAVIGKAELLEKPALCCGTFAGYPLGCKAGLAVIEVIQNEKLPERALELGNYALKRLREMMESYRLIGDVRGRGLMIGVEIVKDEKRTRAPEEAKKIQLEMQKGGVAAILHPMHNVIRLQPPLTITREQLDKGLEVFEESVKKVEKQKP